MGLNCSWFKVYKSKEHGKKCPDTVFLNSWSMMKKFETLLPVFVDDTIQASQWLKVEAIFDATAVNVEWVSSVIIFHINSSRRKQISFLDTFCEWYQAHVIKPTLFIIWLNSWTLMVPTDDTYVLHLRTTLVSMNPGTADSFRSKKWFPFRKKWMLHWLLIWQAFGKKSQI